METADDAEGGVDGRGRKGGDGVTPGQSKQ
jgi:hypothetical protein